MSDILRTALKGSGSITMKIDRWPSGDFHLYVSECWERSFAPLQSVITAEQMDTAKDPDALIRLELERMVNKAHIYYEVGELRKWSDDECVSIFHPK